LPHVHSFAGLADHRDEGVKVLGPVKDLLPPIAAVDDVIADPADRCSRRFGQKAESS
jgi:hypothetical protein